MATPVCACGCGRPLRGYIKGQPTPRFIRGHNAKQPTKPPGERLWAKVDQSAGPNGCWPWTGGTVNGYGMFYDGAGRMVRAHRLAWELTHGPIPPGLEVCHTVCDNPPCCNPSHMTTKPHKGNMEEMVAKGRHRALRGERHPCAKLTEPRVLEIRECYSAGGVTKADLALRFGVSRGTIRHVIAGRTWPHVQEAEAHVA